MHSTVSGVVLMHGQHNATDHRFERRGCCQTISSTTVFVWYHATARGQAIAQDLSRVAMDECCHRVHATSCWELRAGRRAVHDEGAARLHRTRGRQPWQRSALVPRLHRCFEAKVSGHRLWTVGRGGTIGRGRGCSANAHGYNGTYSGNGHGAPPQARMHTPFHCSQPLQTST